MVEKPAYEALERKIKVLEEAAIKAGQVQKAYRESNESFTGAFLMSPISMAITAVKDGRYVEVNEAFAKMMGFKREELMHHTSISAGYITPEQRAVFLDEYREKGCVENLELQIRVKGGESRYGLFNSSKIVTAGEDYFLTTVTDITGRKQAEEALRNSEERFRSLVETTSDWIWEADAQGVYTYASPQVKEILGYEPSEILGKTPLDLMPPDEAARVAKLMLQYFKAIKPFTTFENINLHKDGRRIVLETSGVPVVSQNGELTGYRGVDRDITNRKQAEEEREKLIAELQKALSEVKTLSGMLPICASCKKIRDDKGYWSQIESYIEKHSQAAFTHGICPDCMKKLYPEFCDEE